jgi:hypothetical protein
MYINHDVSPLTVGSIAPLDTYDFTGKYTQWNANVAVAPTQCAGDLHVFGCQHAETCKCGKATRTVEPRICPHCKKAHD